VCQDVDDGNASPRWIAGADGEEAIILGASQQVIRVRPAERVEGDQTPGMRREQALAVPGMWAGLVRTEAHMTTGWHHHADYDTSIYVVSGSLRMESGRGGTHVVEALPGDFLYVPKGAIHREGNPGDQESHLVVVRAGHGPAVINVDGPPED
jgi:uncharacterized RmlC-like cupin family protein